jgi:hypothetical protein
MPVFCIGLTPCASEFSEDSATRVSYGYLWYLVRMVPAFSTTTTSFTYRPPAGSSNVDCYHLLFHYEFSADSFASTLPLPISSL